MTKYAISACYDTGALGFIDLPEGKTWDDVKQWYVKWDCFHYVLNGTDEWKEIWMNSDSSDSTDWKRPNCVSVFPCDEDGEPDYDEELAGTS